MTVYISNKKICPQCDSIRKNGVGIVAINCKTPSLSEWFCGYVCLLDFFNKMEKGDFTRQFKNVLGEPGLHD